MNETDSNVDENNLAHVVMNASNIILDAVDHMLSKIKLDRKGKLIETLACHTNVNCGHEENSFHGICCSK